jgi:hypothetical protein
MESKVCEKVIEILVSKIELLEWQLRRAEQEATEAKEELKARIAESK